MIGLNSQGIGCRGPHAVVETTRNPEHNIGGDPDLRTTRFLSTVWSYTLIQIRVQLQLTGGWS